MYDGPIEVGMTFLWEPMEPHATEHIRVTNVVDNGEERWITTQAWVPTSKISGDYTGESFANEESRFREAVIVVIDTSTEGGES